MAFNFKHCSILWNSIPHIQLFFLFAKSILCQRTTHHSIGITWIVQKNIPLAKMVEPLYFGFKKIWNVLKWAFENWFITWSILTYIFNTILCTFLSYLHLNVWRTTSSLCYYHWIRTLKDRTNNCLQIENMSTYLFQK